MDFHMMSTFRKEMKKWNKNWIYYSSIIMKSYSQLL